VGALSALFGGRGLYLRAPATAARRLNLARGANERCELERSEFGRLDAARPATVAGAAGSWAGAADEIVPRARLEVEHSSACSARSARRRTDTITNPSQAGRTGRTGRTGRARRGRGAPFRRAPGFGARAGSAASA
jgi:hypothetical protein